MDLGGGIGRFAFNLYQTSCSWVNHIDAIELCPERISHGYQALLSFSKRFEFNKLKSACLELLELFNQIKLNQVKLNKEKTQVLHHQDIFWEEVKEKEKVKEQEKEKEKKFKGPSIKWMLIKDYYLSWQEFIIFCVKDLGIRRIGSNKFQITDDEIKQIFRQHGFKRELQLMNSSFFKCHDSIKKADILFMNVDFRESEKAHCELHSLLKNAKQGAKLYTFNEINCDRHNTDWVKKETVMLAVDWNDDLWPFTAYERR